ncbi:MAG: hypothetical protein AAGF12_36410 [Myxococcota bacterium]
MIEVSAEPVVGGRHYAPLRPRMTTEPNIIVQHREQLAELLTEAAEVEHNLMCCYLYAAGSLKHRTDGLSEAQAATIERWRRAIIDVAIDDSKTNRSATGPTERSVFAASPSPAELGR